MHHFNRLATNCTPLETKASTRSKFSPTKKNRPCRICGDVSGKCRESSSGLILCMSISSQSDAPIGFAFTGMTTCGLWGMLTPSNSNEDNYLSALERRVLADERKARRSAAADVERTERAKSARTLRQRDTEIRAKSNDLTWIHTKALLDRGMSAEWIIEMSRQGLLWEESKGFGIGALDVETGLIAGGQLARDDRNPKYSWGIFPGDNRLPETDENPLFPLISPKFDRTLPIELCFCEGSGKPMVSACKAWDLGRHQQIWIGASGGCFSPNALKRGLEAIGYNPKRDTVTLYPDGGACFNPNVTSSYAALAEQLPDLRVAWWDQWLKRDSRGALDCDEISADTEIQIISWKEYLTLTLGTDIGATNQWKDSLAFTADRTFDSQYVNIEAPKAGVMLALKSGLGTGKTQWFLKLAMIQFLAAVAIAPTIALGGNVNERAAAMGVNAGTIGSLTAKGATEALRNASKLWTLCPDSILSIEPHEMVGKVLLIDEAMECFTAFLSRPTEIKKYRKLAIDRLSQLMTAAASVVIADGNLTDRALVWFQKLCPSKPIEKVQNLQSKKMTYRLHLGTKESFTSHIGHEGDERWLLGTDSKADATAISEYPLTSDTCKTGALDADGNVKDSWAQAAMRSAKSFIQTHKPHNMAYSPVAGSGWDVSGVDGYFERVYGYYCGVVGPKAITQSLARYRDFDVVRDVWVSPHGMPDMTAVDSTSTKQADINEALYRFVASTASGLIGEDGAALVFEAYRVLLSALEQDPTAIAFLGEQTSKNFESKHLRACTIYLLVQSGHTVRLTGGRAKCEGSNVKEVKRAHKLDRAAQIIAADIITKAEADRIKMAARVAPGRQAALARFELEIRLPGIALSEEWNSDVVDQWTQERVADRFVLGLHDLASQAEKFYLLCHLTVSKKRGQARYQKFLTDGWIDLSQVKTSFNKAAKIKAVLGVEMDEILKGAVVENCTTGDPENRCAVSVTDDIPKSFSLKKIQIEDMVKNLRWANGLFPRMGRRSAPQYLKEVLAGFGLVLDKIGETDEYEITAPCLEPGTNLATVYDCVVKRHSLSAETDKPHEWVLPMPKLIERPEEPCTPQSDDPMAYIDRGPEPQPVEEFDGGTYEYTYEFIPESDAVATVVAGGGRSDWEDFITQMVGLSTSDPIAYQSHRATPGLAPDWVWLELECEDF